MKSIVYLVPGIVLIGIGAYREFGQSAVSADDAARCEMIVRDGSAENAGSLEQLLAQCQTPGFVAMMDARTSAAGAPEAARAISAINRGGLINTVINCVLAGAGTGALGAAAGACLRKSRSGEV